MLKKRIRVGLSIDAVLVERLKKLSEETRINQSRLVDEALELLLEKHHKEEK